MEDPSLRWAARAITGAAFLGIVLGSAFQKVPVHRLRLKPVLHPAAFTAPPPKAPLAFVATVSSEKVEPTVQPVIVAYSPPQPALGSHEDWLRAAGIAESDWTYVTYILNHESGWRVNATEPSTHAYGLCQSLPASKMASAGADWPSNPITQLRWCNSYAASRYGSWYNAYVWWSSHRWW